MDKSPFGETQVESFFFWVGETGANLSQDFFVPLAVAVRSCWFQTVLPIPIDMDNR